MSYCWRAPFDSTWTLVRSAHLVGPPAAKSALISEKLVFNTTVLGLSTRPATATRGAAGTKSASSGVAGCAKSGSPSATYCTFVPRRSAMCEVAASGRDRRLARLHRRAARRTKMRGTGQLHVALDAHGNRLVDEHERVARLQRRSARAARGERHRVEGPKTLPSRSTPTRRRSMREEASWSRLRAASPLGTVASVDRGLTVDRKVRECGGQRLAGLVLQHASGAARDEHDRQLRLELNVDRRLDDVRREGRRDAVRDLVEIQAVDVNSSGQRQRNALGTVDVDGSDSSGWP